MPFYLHIVNTDPLSGTGFKTKRDAVAHLTKGMTITCVADMDERFSWVRRELERFASCLYTPLPWHITGGKCCDNMENPWPSQYVTLLNADEEEPTVFLKYSYEQLSHYRNASVRHFAHISMQSDGMIAYTPDDAHGLEDRQKKIRCGRYLEMVAPFLSSEHRDILCAQVKAHASAEFKIATTADDIVSVYCSGYGFTSCMDGRNFDRSNPNHPVRVYGDSDVAVAYLGSIDQPIAYDSNARILSDDEEEGIRDWQQCGCSECMTNVEQLKGIASPTRNRVTARCVIWPEKKIYTRIYGDPILTFLLRNAGYSNGSLHGARIRRLIRKGSSDRYVMPYIDGVEYVEEIHGNDQFLRLSDDGGSDSLGAKETCGYVYLRHFTTCDHCEERFEGSEDEAYCSTCNSRRWECDYCNTEFFERDYTLHRDQYANRVCLCQSCEDKSLLTCETENCDCTFYDDQYTNRQRNEVNTHDAIMCPQCATARITECQAVRDLNAPLPLTNESDPYPVVMRFRHIPIGAHIRVIEIPHHTGTKIDTHTIRWNPCSAIGHSLCPCSEASNATRFTTADIPLDKEYEVLSEVDPPLLRVIRCNDVAIWDPHTMLQCVRVGFSSVYFRVPFITEDEQTYNAFGEHNQRTVSTSAFSVGSAYRIVRYEDNGSSFPKYFAILQEVRS